MGARRAEGAVMAAVQPVMAAGRAVMTGRAL